MAFDNTLGSAPRLDGGTGEKFSLGCAWGSHLGRWIYYLSSLGITFYMRALSLCVQYFNSFARHFPTFEAIRLRQSPIVDFRNLYEEKEGHSQTMDTKIGIDMKILCFFCILLMKACASSMTCCFEIMGNGSVSYHLSEPAGENCTPTWAQNETVLVDEHRNTDESKVVYVEPQKLILKQNTEGNVKQVTYQKDCPSTGLAYNVECQDPCVALDASTTTPALYSDTTQVPGRDHSVYIVSGIIAIIIIIIIIIPVTTIIICRRRKICQTSNGTSRLFWKAVPKNETSNSTVLEME